MGGLFNGWRVEAKKYCDKMLYGKWERDEGLKPKQSKKPKEMHLPVQ